jgi:alpha-methylacyl-CoA racemase
VPFAGALLADLGADVVRVDRVPVPGRAPDLPPRFDFYNRNKRSVAFDLKQPAGVQSVLSMVRKADVLLEGMRPGVTDRLGVGPDACLAANPRLVYGRMTGWGQQGPLAQEAGHDINYLALTGALACLGEPGRPPPPPLNLVADLGGGAMYLAVGVLAAAMAARASGRGQVVDAAMIDGVTPDVGLSGVSPEVPGRRIAARTSRWRRAVRHLGADGRLSPSARSTAVLCLAARRAGARRRRWRKTTAAPGRRCAIVSPRSSHAQDDWVRIAARRDACLSPVLTIDERRSIGRWCAQLTARRPAASSRRPARRHAGTLSAARRTGAGGGDAGVGPRRDRLSQWRRRAPMTFDAGRPC